MELGVAVEVVEELLVVVVLVVPLVGAVVAEVVPERHQQHVSGVQLRLLAVLIQ